MNVKSKTFFLLLLPVLAFGHQGDTEFKRTIVKQLTVNNNASLDIVNKYGKIVVHTWGKNEIKATIIITGYGKSNSEAQEIAGAVKVDIDENPSHVSMRTGYNPGKGSKWFFWNDKKDSKDYVSINYELYVPQSLAMLSLENNFGDVITDVLPFPARMKLNYCFYAIKEARKPLELTMNYCSKGSIDKAGLVKLRASYSNVRGEQIDRLEARSNYSNYTINKIGELETNANYDEYTIKQAVSIEARGNYTTFRINMLHERVDMQLLYGEVTAKELSPGFKGGDIKLTYTDLKLGIPHKAALQISVNLTYGDLETDGLSLKNVNSMKKNNKLVYTAFTTNGGEQAPVINIQGMQSQVTLTGK